MVQLSLGDLLNRLRENFSASGSNLAATVVTRLNALPPRIQDLKQLDDDLTAFAGADFGPFYTRSLGLASQIITIPGMPVPGTPLVPATPPASLGRTDITGYIGNIRTYLSGALNTDIGTTFANIRTAIGAANAKRHYYFNIRLPLRVHTAPSPGAFVDYIIFHIAGALSDALKSYLKCQWTGTPSQIADMHSFIDGLSITDANRINFLLTALLVENENSANPHAFAPLPDYHSHIIST